VTSSFCFCQLHGNFVPRHPPGALPMDTVLWGLPSPYPSFVIFKLYHVVCYDWQNCLALSERWKLSDAHCEINAHRKMSHDQSLTVTTDGDCTSTSSRLATIGVLAKDICAFIADQPAKDFDQYAKCLELVSRGLVSGKVQVMVEHLRLLLDEPSTECSDVQPVDTPCRRPFFTSANGNTACTYS